MVDFNPRSHEGSDSEDRINIYQVNISIHAPTRGATPVSTPIPGIHCIFQSTLPRGERLEEKILSEELQKFQSTLPRGERPNCFDHCQGEMDISIHAPTRGATVFSFLLKDAEKDFNPRSHEGSDDFPWNIPFHI